jgi:transglutaminase 1
LSSATIDEVKPTDATIRGPSNEMSAAVPLLEKGSELQGSWTAVYEGQMDSHLMVAITPAADSIVAAWRLDIDTKLSGGSSLSYTHPQPIYVLFNPWCLNDSVYMPGIYCLRLGHFISVGLM